MNSMKGNNPQKNYLRKIYKILFYLGVGDFWYEDSHHTKKQKLLYKIWTVISYFYIITFNINVLLAYLRTELNENEQTDLVQFSIGFTIVTAKIYFLNLKKEHIKEFLPRLLEGTRSVLVSESLDEACVKKCLLLSVTVVIALYSAVITATIDGIRGYLDEGIPIRTVVAYYPPSSASGLLANIMRFFVQLYWWFEAGILSAIDCLCLCTMVIARYKFKILEQYFINLRGKVLENATTESRISQKTKFKKHFVMGIKMHEEALWCAKSVQLTLGIIYSIQIFECVLLLVLCLIKLVAEKHDVSFLLANCAYIVCVILLTGVYMLPAADITNEASLVPTWMFHSGWEMVPSRDVTVLMVFALLRAQTPVRMTAFGILMLSYANFVSVIRSSYSFFAVMK